MNNTTDTLLSADKQDKIAELEAKITELEKEVLSLRKIELRDLDEYIRKLPNLQITKQNGFIYDMENMEIVSGPDSNNCMYKKMNLETVEISMHDTKSFEIWKKTMASFLKVIYYQNEEGFFTKKVRDHYQIRYTVITTQDRNSIILGDTEPVN